MVEEVAEGTGRGRGSPGSISVGGWVVMVSGWYGGARTQSCGTGLPLEICGSSACRRFLEPVEHLRVRQARRVLGRQAGPCVGDREDAAREGDHLAADRAEPRFDMGTRLRRACRPPQLVHRMLAGLVVSVRRRRAESPSACPRGGEGEHDPAGKARVPAGPTLPTRSPVTATMARSPAAGGEAPAGHAAEALIVTDGEDPGRTFMQWTVRIMMAGGGPTPTSALGLPQGGNTGGDSQYAPACPPTGDPPDPTCSRATISEADRSEAGGAGGRGQRRSLRRAARRSAPTRLRGS